MKLSRKLAIAVLPLAAILAGCQSTAPQAPTQAQQPAAQEQQANPKAEQAQVASVEVFAATDKVVKGYRPVKLSEKQTIYVAKEPVFNRSDVTAIEPLQDNKGRAFVRLQLNDKAIKALNALPKDRGFVTVIGGQVASLSGFREGKNYVFLVRDVQAAQAIVAAITGSHEQAAAPKNQPAKK